MGETKIEPPPTGRDVLEWLAKHRDEIGAASPRDIPERLQVAEILERLVLDGRLECRRSGQRCHPSGAALASGRGGVQLSLSVEARRELLGERPASVAPAIDDIVLEPGDVEILRCLADRPRLFVLYQDIAVGCDRDRDAVSVRVREHLLPHGLVELRPRRGCTLTTRGSEWLKRFAPPA